MSTIYDWSLNASENAYCDDLIDWSKGQRPSSLNNSARVMMQRIKEYLSDTSGIIENTFTVDGEQQTTLIRLQSKSQFLKYKNGLSICFKAKGKNVGSTMIALNALSGKPVYKATDSGLLALSGGEFQKGCIYHVVYRDEGWHVLNPTPFSLPKAPVIPVYPTGTIGIFGMQVLPSGWLLCDGQAYLRSDYPALYDAIGTRWGGSESWTKFNVPDLRGVFLRGVDDDREIDRWRYLGTLQHDAMRKHKHDGQTVTILNDANEEESWYGDMTIIWGYELNEQQREKLAERLGVRAENIRVHHGLAFPHSHLHMRDIELVSSGVSETRPINMSVVFGIKT
ncbi:phage tail protein [Bartonella krasnovii]|uniref:Phage protein n=1 Tax=Bartonella krasnovii TaxID=2267275 RepID=A0A5B9D146_9HYPH|nr:phage tail protein [Bartonella krasnovii]QEE12266.1 phage protein [Bartonella krasnovii]UNF29797.1 phage tail protein [Bartonella krasnovii]UNF36157.1 phage tail protein [Bartonella krasnovii]UNF37864.1 phage tail protein [Bartonella krasnovii]UNF41263.1 phage tail protein [Bartonella krasnovii]